MSDSEQLRSETELGEASVAFYRQRAEECRQRMLRANEAHRAQPRDLVLRNKAWKAKDDWDFALYQYEKAKRKLI